MEPLLDTLHAYYGMEPSPETLPVKATLLDRSLPILNAEFSGTVGYRDFLRFCSWRMGAYPDATAVLTDLTQVSQCQLSPTEMHDLVAWTAAHTPLLRRAIVAPHPAQYGIARMFQILSEVGFQLTRIQVFGNRPEAIEWLRTETSAAARRSASR